MPAFTAARAGGAGVCVIRGASVRDGVRVGELGAAARQLSVRELGRGGWLGAGWGRGGGGGGGALRGGLGGGGGGAGVGRMGGGGAGQPAARRAGSGSG